MQGFVYVMSNAAMPGLLKVGYTERTPELRAQEMSAHESLPDAMRIEYYAFVERSAQDIESATHRMLHKFHRNKEWFSCEVPEAVVAIKAVASTSLLYDKLYYESPEAVIRKQEEKIRLDNEEKSLIETQSVRTLALKKRQEELLQHLRGEFHRLEPLARKAYFKGVGKDVLKEILTFGSLRRDLGLSKTSEAGTHEKNISDEDLMLLAAFYRCDWLLKKYSSRPSKPGFLDRQWSGDYFEVPPVVLDEFRRRQESLRLVSSRSRAVPLESEMRELESITKELG